MKKVFRILRYVKGYKTYAGLNILFNILSVIFSLFSITMAAPFLDLLFMKDQGDYTATLAKGQPVLTTSVQSMIDTFYYELSKFIVNDGNINDGKIKALVFICVLVVVFTFIKNLFRYLAMFFLANIRNGVVKDIRNDIYQKTIRLPLSYYSDERKGDIMSRITTDVQEIEWSIMNSLEMLFRDPINIVVLLATMFFMNVHLTLYMFLLLPLPGFLIGKIASSLKRSSSRAKEKLGSIFSIMEETLGGLRIIKGFNAEKSSFEKFEKENEAFTQHSIKMYRKNDLASPLSEILGVAILAVLMYLGGKEVIDSGFKASVFITFIAIFSQILPPAKALTTAWYNVQRGVASVERIEKILDANEVIHEHPNAKPAPEFGSSIEYKNVSFAYKKGDDGWVLRDINLVVPKGKTIALVGQSGSGKTTLADMLPRFFDADKGEIFIDGVSLKEIKIKELRALMGIVSQESILFNDTVFNNIAFGMPDAKKEDVINAAKIANAHEFIVQMENAYDTNIGDRGGKLSGGQRQRISIARAVLKNPPILILDEATSALDTESEKLVQDALERLMKNRTSIVIAHRLSTIQHADEIIVMQKGEIIERGTHKDLIQTNGAYKKLYEIQAFV